MISILIAQFVFGVRLSEWKVWSILHVQCRWWLNIWCSFSLSKSHINIQILSFVRLSLALFNFLVPVFNVHLDLLSKCDIWAYQIVCWCCYFGCVLCEFFVSLVSIVVYKLLLSNHNLHFGAFGANNNIFREMYFDMWPFGM